MASVGGGRSETQPVARGQPEAAPTPRFDAPPQPEAPPRSGPTAGGAAPPTFEKLVALFKARREPLLAVQLERHVHLVRYDPQAARLEFRPTSGAAGDLAGRLGKCLEAWTGRRWGVLISNEPGDPTLFEQTLTGVRANPLVQAVLTAFPDATIGAVRDLEEVAGDGLGPATAPAGDPADDLESDDLEPGFYDEPDDLNGDDDT